MIKENILEKFFLILVSISFFIGIWNSFPMTSAIFDEMFAGGILRSIESYSIFPQGTDILYGTLTYYFSYFVVLLILLFSLIFLGFDISALKIFIVDNIHVVYLGPRILSSVCGVVVLLFLNSFLKKTGKDLKTRLFLLTILFTSILNVIIFHTSKVWVLSMFFVILSFVFLYNFLDDINHKNAKKNIFLSVLFSFLAFANFPLAGFSLINIPIIYFYLQQDKKLFFEFLKFVFFGFVIFLLISISNYGGVEPQIKSIIFDYTLSENARAVNLSIAESIKLNIWKILMCYPIFIGLFGLFLCQKNKIINKKLLILSSLYTIVYFLVISLVARWSLDEHSFLRYLFPFSFFFFFVLASFNFKLNYKILGTGLISVIYWLFILYYLSVPTTYVESLNWINKNLNNEKVVLFNNASGEYDLLKNKESYSISHEEYCGSRCKEVIHGNLNSDINYIVLDEQTDNKYKSIELYLDKNKYMVSNYRLDSDNFKLVNSFVNNKNDKQTFFVDSLGSYFERDFFTIGRLGKNIYIYEII